MAKSTGKTVDIEQRSRNNPGVPPKNIWHQQDGASSHYAVAPRSKYLQIGGLEVLEWSKVSGPRTVRFFYGLT